MSINVHTKQFLVFSRIKNSKQLDYGSKLTGIILLASTSLEQNRFEFEIVSFFVKTIKLERVPQFSF